jgi:23S rRNA (cytosine1962-C5)-methyltransferase
MQSILLTPKFEAFYNRLLKVYTTLSKQAAQKGIGCYRLYQKDLPEHPLIIDIYESNAVVYEYESKHKLTEDEYDLWLDTCISIIKDVLSISDKQLYLKVRRRKRDRLNQYQKIDEKQELIIVQEYQCKFYINLHDYLDTGLFLDHRPTRKLIGKLSNGKRVLNLFCYTASFSIYAALAGASEVWSADLSNTYIQWAQQNAQLNNCNNPHIMQWYKVDVLQWIATLPPNYFDIVICDPPTFSNSKMMHTYWDVQEHHAQLLLQLKSKCTRQAQIYFSTNARQFVLNENLSKNFTSIQNITEATTDFDFKKKLQRYCYLLQL